MEGEGEEGADIEDEEEVHIVECGEWLFGMKADCCEEWR